MSHHLGGGSNQGNDSIDIDTFDIDNLVGDIIDDDLDAAFIPSKDSSDEDKPVSGDEIAAVLEMEEFNKKDLLKPGGNQQNQRGQMGRNTINTLAENVIDDINVDTPIGDTPNASMDMEQFTLKDIDPFGEEEEKKNGRLNDFDIYDDEELPKIDLKKGNNQDILDETVMTLLHPDYFQISSKLIRREQLKKHTPSIQHWKASQIDSEIVDVADAMSHIESIAMHDQDWYTSKHKDDEKNKEQYWLKETELFQLKMVPPSFFGKVENRNLDKNDGEAGKSVGSGLDYLRSNTESQIGLSSSSQIGSSVLGGFRIGGKSEVIVCGACGVKLKFRARKRHRYNYIGYKCIHTHSEWVFHDYLCVKLRKIKEAIKNYVLEKEKDANPNIEDENALINIETNVSQKENYRARPIKKTTPKKGDHNYNLDGGDVSEREDSTSSRRSFGNYEYSKDSRMTDDGATDDEDDRDRYGVKSSSNIDLKKKEKPKYKKEKTIRDKNFAKLGYVINDDITIPKHLHFRRYRTHVKRIWDRLNTEKKYKGDKLTYKDRFGKLPDILLYCDLNEFGPAIFEFVSESLKSKMRKSLWHILEWLALEMPTNEILHLLKRHTYLLSKHELVNYDKICKATMEGSKFPIACTLRLSAFMYERAEVDVSNRDAFRKKGEQYVNVARKLLKEIESDHLFALLLMIPTDIGHQNVIEIALKYDLTYFLEEPRIVRVFSVIWFNGFDFLDPDNSFSEPDISVDTIFDKLMYEPGRFFFSAFGKFVISSILYLGYLALFSYVTFLRIYDYPPTYNALEVVLWISSAGYVVHEILEFTDSPKEYFSSMTNYWDILIALNWIILFYIRFINPSELQYGDDGTLDEMAQRNTLSTEIYMACWSLQCVILWTRVASVFKISERAGPLIRMIMNMLGDVGNFFLIWGLFFIGGSFAAYYIIGDDLQSVPDVELGTLSSVSFYIFKTLIGQQDWDKTASVENTDDPSNPFPVFDELRSNFLQSLLFFYSIFGTILLLNLLIAMMASSYEAVKDKSLQELNKQKIDTIYELDRSRAVITPPFNVVAYFFYAYWYAFEIIAWALTFGHRQFNEEYFSPINKGITQYSEGDIIVFRKNNADVKGVCISKTPKALRTTVKGHFGRASMVNPNSSDEDFEADLVVEVKGKKQNLRDPQIIKVKKTCFKRRRLRIPSLMVENKYCRYCRYNLNNDRMTITYYLSLFERKGQHIDPDDKRYMKELIATIDENGIPVPLTCNLCPNCYRPFKVLTKGPDVMNRMQFILEIVSYYVFAITLRWTLILISVVPAFIIKCIKWIFKTFARRISGKSSDRATKSIMNTSEENDDYRAKVRQVSKQEEKLDAVVRRIDTSVNRLESTLLGDLINDDIDDDDDDDDEFKEDIHNLRSDEFDEEIKKMKQELNKKFQQIEKLLNRSGYDD